MNDETKNALMTTTAPAPVSYTMENDDGLSSFSLEQLGEKVSVFNGARLMKFNNGTFIVPREGETIDSKREFVVFGLTKLLQKFVGEKLISSEVIPPRGNFPDIEKLNKNAPPEEWGVDPGGKAVGPYKGTLVLKLLDGLNPYVFVTQTKGGKMAFAELTNKIKLLRRLKGNDMTVVVTCESIRFRSDYNIHGVPRPHFNVVKYVQLAGGDDTPEPEPKGMLPSVRPAMTAGEKLDAFAGAPATPVEPAETSPGYTFLKLPTEPLPSLKDEMKDELPF
jgi:hypothetical protein